MPNTRRKKNVDVISTVNRHNLSAEDLDADGVLDYEQQDKINKPNLLVKSANKAKKGENKKRKVDKKEENQPERGKIREEAENKKAKSSRVTTVRLI